MQLVFIFTDTTLIVTTMTTATPSISSGTTITTSITVSSNIDTTNPDTITSTSIGVSPKSTTDFNNPADETSKCFMHRYNMIMNIKLLGNVSNFMLYCLSVYINTECRKMKSYRGSQY